MSATCFSSGFARRAGLGIAAALMVTAPPTQAAGDDTARLCLDAARMAAERSGVPLRVLLAMSLTETGRSVPGRSEGGALMPWPWAVNRAGQSLWFDDRAAAAAYVGAAIARGERNLDLGCFQLNWGWHGANFASVDAMLDPVANAGYAAALVARHHARGGDWRAAAAAYHSSTPAVAARYLARFEPIYESLGGHGRHGHDPGHDPGRADPGGAGPDAGGARRPAAPSGADAANAFPLLRPGPTAGLGSLVPVAAAARPLLAGE